MSTVRGHRTEAQARASGQSIVEFALLLPVIVMLTIGMIDLCRLYFAYTTLQNAAAEGARATVGLDLYTATPSCLSGGSSGDTGPIVNQAVAEAAVLGLDSTALTGSAAPLSNTNFTLTGLSEGGTATLCTPISSYTFTASYTFKPLVSLILGWGSITLTTTSTMQAE